MATEIDVTMPDDVRGVIDGIGRTEDVAFSSDDRRLAVAGFGTDRIIVFELVLPCDEGGTPCLIGATELRSSTFAEPHGVAFLGPDAVVVANRGGDLGVFRLPPPAEGVRSIDAAPVLRFGGEGIGHVKMPGSVAAVSLGADLFEVLVCDNVENVVGRYVVDLRAETIEFLGEIVGNGLDIPDGVTTSRDGRWIAVSSHNFHCVLVQPNDADLGRYRMPFGVLGNVLFPHGLQFAPDGRHLLVADAGHPYVHVFVVGSDGWQGTQDPIATVRVMDDDVFLRGRHNPAEGGPKGLAIDGSGRFVVVSSAEQPLAFFPLSTFVEDRSTNRAESLGSAPAAGAETARVLLLGALSRATALEHERSDLIVARDALHAHLATIEARVAELSGGLDAAGHELAACRVVVDEQRAELERAATAAVERERQLSEQSAAATSTLAELRAVAAARAAEAAEFTSQLAHLGAVVDDQELRLAAMRSSRSWRVSAPLRILHGLVGVGRGQRANTSR